MRGIARALLLGVSALASSAASAQTDASVEDEGARGGLEDIVVTARKVEESLQDAPVAVSVVSGEKIRDLGLNSIDDFARQSTGISFSQAFGRSTDRPVIRGQSNVLAGVQAGVETGAAFFIDGIYYQGDIQGFDPESIERVEIIKGPQSALYGRNTYAGAINYVTKDPSQEFTVTGRARAAEYDEYEIAGSVSGPILGDKLGFRAGGRFFTYGGQYRNQLTGRKVGDEETISGYLTVTANPSEDLKLRVRSYYQKDDDGPLALFLQGAAANNCKPGFRSPNFRTQSPFLPLAPATLASNNQNQYFCGTIQPQPRGVRLNTDPLPINATLGTRDGTAFDGVENEQYQLQGILDWDIAGSGWVLSSLTGYRRNTNLFGTDSDHSEAFAYFGGTAASTLGTEPAFANTNRDRQIDFSQEVRLSTPADQPLRAMIGGFYFKQRFQSRDITFASGRAAVPLGSDQTNFSTIQNVAAFGLLEWKPSERFSITGEIRYQEEEKTQIERGVGGASVFCAGEAGKLAQFGAPATVTCLPRAKFTGTDPRVTVNYTTPGGTLFYAVYAQGRKPGGFNGAAGIIATQQAAGGQDFTTYAEERSKGVEVGVKWQTVDNVFRGSFAFFRNDLSNVQLTNAIPNPTGTGAITSIVSATGDARTTGFELELQAAPTRGLILSTGVTYVDARFRNGCDTDEFILNSGGLRPNFNTDAPPAAGLALCSIKGRRLPLGSPWIINGNATYESDEIGNSGMRLFTNANFSFEDSKYVQVDNLAQTGDTFLVNGRIGFRTDNLTVAVFGRNLTDEDSVPLATRWFDLRYGAGTRNLPAGVGNPPGLTFDGRRALIETGSPRGFFAALRRGRTFGIEANFRY
jgi:iron complex outermembrane recepter protein